MRAERGDRCVGSRDQESGRGRDVQAKEVDGVCHTHGCAVVAPPRERAVALPGVDPSVQGERTAGGRPVHAGGRRLHGSERRPVERSPSERAGGFVDPVQVVGESIGDVRRHDRATGQREERDPKPRLASEPLRVTAHEQSVRRADDVERSHAPRPPRIPRERKPVQWVERCDPLPVGRRRAPHRLPGKGCSSIVDGRRRRWLHRWFRPPRTCHRLPSRPTSGRAQARRR